jgi:DNA-binding response OmpR family regulator
MTHPLATSPTGRPWRILVIDDDDAVRGCTRALLARAGFDSCEASSADTGLAAARAHPPDLILMDLRMKDLDGVAALVLLRADPVLRATATAAYSGFVPLFGEQRLRDIGFDELIYKPLNYSELLETVTRMLSAPKPPRLLLA